MRNFWIKTSLFLFSLLVFIAGITFLLLNHHDHLVNFVPAEAELYVNADSNVFNKLSEEKKLLLTSWLTNKSSLNAEKWRTILEDANAEIGIFSINGQIFGLLKKTKQTAALINNQTENIQTKDNVIYFPSLKISNDKLTSQAWFKTAYKKISFQPLRLYAKNISAFNLMLPNIPGMNNEAVTILGKIKTDKIKLTVFSQSDVDLGTKLKTRLKTVPSDTQIYFHGIATNKINQEFEYIAGNLSFHILKSINGPIEYLKTTADFQIFADKSLNSLVDLNKNITKDLAMTFPVEKLKALPDGTLATQYIADPSIWNFETIATDAFAGEILREPRLGYDLSITSADKYYIIESKSNKPSLATQLNITPYFRKCSMFNRNGEIYLNYNTDKLSPIVIINKNHSKLVICLY
ncbi:MAG: hypothetical protein AAB575_06060 [Patescibacteria group bacterium]